MRLVAHLLAVLFLLAGTAAAAPSWRQILQQPSEWYGTAEARTIADAVLLYQTESGGWPKNVDMTQPPSAEFLAHTEVDHRAPTIDNGATHTQLRFLARVIDASDTSSAPDTRLLEAFHRGFDYLLRAQYANGGWPQYFPLVEGYFTHITFNDDAMVSVLELLRDVAAGRSPFAFVDNDRRIRAREAVVRGIDCILRCQIVVNGRRTAWCAQHDERTFAPAAARTFEHASLSGYESVGVVKFLMSLDQPAPEVIEAIEAAIRWFEEVQLTGIAISRKPAPQLRFGYDPVVVSQPGAPPLWARFYEIGTNRPIFSGRDRVVRYALADIEPERRGGYRWYVDEPRALLERDYPRWKARLREPANTRPTPAVR